MIDVLWNRGEDSVSTQSEVRTRAVLEAESEAHALRSMTRAEIAGYRRRPGPLPQAWPPIQASTLRNSDEQTIVALAAVASMLQQLVDADQRRFDQWGLLVASRFLGRSNLVVALNRFRSEGVW